ncbi:MULTISPECIES: hypothetical protein [Streptomyces]|uniref:Uncharacterized protein n=1 Tax=Streptomyces lonegramiae TaxID=3075524 RepID=A0ABU2X8J1_9ACTN|nr:hypothetical protein [Streptomyces sp. DSM 41529]MDT0542239.1 hypothetical protein [Streptomyces sp. DSM 41529]
MHELLTWLNSLVDDKFAMSKDVAGTMVTVVPVTLLIGAVEMNKVLDLRNRCHAELSELQLAAARRAVAAKGAGADPAPEDLRIVKLDIAHELRALYSLLGWWIVAVVPKRYEATLRTFRPPLPDDPDRAEAEALIATSRR